MLTPFEVVLNTACYRTQSNNKSEKQFYDNLMLLIEDDQPTQYEYIMRQHYMINQHVLYDSMPNALLKIRWYDRTITNYYDHINSSLEWYLHPPFLFITFFESHLIDLK